MHRLTTAVDRWFPTERPTSHAVRVVLFCLPHAGGSASAFRDWGAGLPTGVQCVPAHLPGRETRLGEPPDIDIVELSRAIARRAGDLPFAIFGHSMGARLGYEAVRQLRRDGGPLPVRLFVSGCRPPHLDVPHSRIARLPDADFFARVAAMGGTPAGVLDAAELRALVLPVLRADFAMMESYRYRPEPALPVPIVALAGAGDPDADPYDITGWSAHSTGSVRLYTLPGDHFFVQSRAVDVYRIVGAELLGSDDGTEVDVELPGVGGATGPAAPVLGEDEVYVRELRLPRGPGPGGDTDEMPDLTAWTVGSPGDAARARRAGLRYSASRHGDLALIAIGGGAGLGVAVERVDPLAVPERYLAALTAGEREWLSYLPEDEVPLAALRIGTAKRAVLKAAGVGPGVSVRDFCFADHGARPWRPEAFGRLESLTGWRVYHLDLAAAAGALALDTGSWRLRFETVRSGGR